MQTYTFQVDGMHCSSCVKVLNLKLGKLQGVTECMVDPLGRAKLVTTRPLSLEEVKKILSDTEYQVSAWNQSKETF